MLYWKSYSSAPCLVPAVATGLLTCGHPSSVQQGTVHCRTCVVFGIPCHRPLTHRHPPCSCELYFCTGPCYPLHMFLLHNFSKISLFIHTRFLRCLSSSCGNYLQFCPPVSCFSKYSIPLRLAFGWQTVFFFPCYFCCGGYLSSLAPEAPGAKLAPGTTTWTKCFSTGSDLLKWHSVRT